MGCLLFILSNVIPTDTVATCARRQPFPSTLGEQDVIMCKINHSLHFLLVTSNESYSSHGGSSPDTRPISMRSTLSDTSVIRQPSIQSIHSESSDDTMTVRPRSSSSQLASRNAKVSHLPHHASDSNLRHSLFSRLSRSTTRYMSTII